MAESVTFERTVSTMIVANTAVLVWGLVDHVHHEVAERFETACLVFFAGELLVRLRQTGWGFFRGGWNVFDAVVLALAVVPLPVNASALRLARLGRIARLVHLGRHISGLRLLQVLRARRLVLVAVAATAPMPGRSHTALSWPSLPNSEHAGQTSLLAG